MPIARLLILTIIVVLVLAIYRRLRNVRKQPDKTINYDATVQCHHCGVHIPTNEAIRKNNHDYCSTEHAIEDEKD